MNYTVIHSSHEEPVNHEITQNTETKRIDHIVNAILNL